MADLTCRRRTILSSTVRLWSTDLCSMSSLSSRARRTAFFYRTSGLNARAESAISHNLQAGDRCSTDRILSMGRSSRHSIAPRHPRLLLGFFPRFPLLLEAELYLRPGGIFLHCRVTVEAIERPLARLNVLLALRPIV